MWFWEGGYFILNKSTDYIILLVFEYVECTLLGSIKKHVWKVFVKTISWEFPIFEALYLIMYFHNLTWSLQYEGNTIIIPII